VDTLNFSFWSDRDEHAFTKSYNQRSYSGYWSLCAAINSALDRGIPLTKAAFLATIDTDQLRSILTSETGEIIPLLEERVRCLREIGTVLIEKFEGSFVTCIRLANFSSMKLLDLIVENFSSYRDQMIWKEHGKEVFFYKRAQILIADIWACFEGKGLGEFYDIDQLTMFADYRLVMDGILCPFWKPFI